MARRAAKDDDEAPEADRLVGFPHPRETRDLFGQSAAEAALRQAFDGGRMHHGWLMTGPQGIGKATLAYRLARYVLASQSERAQSAPGRLEAPAGSVAARQVLAQTHPGLLVVRRAADGKRMSSVIRVDDVRRLKSFLGLTAGEGQWRVVIVDPADDLNQSSANALLKSLEEPPARTLFVLISAAPGNLLATIRSRCRSLELRPLGGEDLWRAAEQAVVAAEAPVSLPAAGERERLAMLSRGSVRRLLALAAGDGLELYTRLLALLDGLPRLDVAALHALADEIAPMAAEQKLETFFGLLLDLLARMVRAAAVGAGAGRNEARLAQRLIARESLASWAELWDIIVRDKAVTMELNLDRRSLVLQTGFRMRALALQAGA